MCRAVAIKIRERKSKVGGSYRQITEQTGAAADESNGVIIE